MLTVREALTTLYREAQGETELQDIQRDILIEFVKEKFDKDFNGYGDKTIRKEYMELYMKEGEKIPQKDETHILKVITAYTNELERQAYLLRELDAEHDMAYGIEQIVVDLRNIVKGHRYE